MHDSTHPVRPTHRELPPIGTPLSTSPIILTCVLQSIALHCDKMPVSAASAVRRPAAFQ